MAAGFSRDSVLTALLQNAGNEANALAFLQSSAPSAPPAPGGGGGAASAAGAGGGGGSDAEKARIQAELDDVKQRLQAAMASRDTAQIRQLMAARTKLTSDLSALG